MSLCKIRCRGLITSYEEASFWEALEGTSLSPAGSLPLPSGSFENPRTKLPQNTFKEPLLGNAASFTPHLKVISKTSINYPSLTLSENGAPDTVRLLAAAKSWKSRNPREEGRSANAAAKRTRASGGSVRALGPPGSAAPNSPRVGAAGARLAAGPARCASRGAGSPAHSPESRRQRGRGNGADG